MGALFDRAALRRPPAQRKSWGGNAFFKAMNLDYLFLALWRLSAVIGRTVNPPRGGKPVACRGYSRLL